MLTDQLKELQTAKAHVAELEQTVGRKRARITDEQRAEVKRLLATGQTGVEISAGTGLSLPSIQAIKKNLGLVKTRK